MGLDQYLKAKKYVSGWKSDPDSEYEKIVELLGQASVKGGPGMTIEMTAAYWRKANAIHKWFVDNAQDGNDDCGEYHVEKHQLKALVECCKTVMETVNITEGLVGDGSTHYPDGTVEHHTTKGRVITNPGVANRLLPTTDGFFFGSTDYDEWYIQDLERTIEQLEPIINGDEFDGYELYYQSSW